MIPSRLGGGDTTLRSKPMINQKRDKRKPRDEGISIISFPRTIPMGGPLWSMDKRRHWPIKRSANKVAHFPLPLFTFKEKRYSENLAQKREGETKEPYNTKIQGTKFTLLL
jgi:hypothetical protein